ncbi:MAG: hypothetical protein HY706_14555 [Candidatus Hydrogenedentes bacterium]|nr:hypothetical protein [Candidatus Hydrogenedentota bacterium]
MPRLAEYDSKITFYAAVKRSERITPEDSPDEVRHIILEVEPSHLRFQVGQNIGVVVPGPHEFGNKEHFRLYSIAGLDEGRHGDTRTLSICVRRCFYIDDFNGERYPGVASNYLCDCRAGDLIALAGPFDSPFKLPDDPASNLIMVGLGTGIAPFRAFIRYIYDTVGGWKGKVRLFYGAKTGMELLYMNDRNNDLANYYDEKTFKAFEAVSPSPALDAPIALDQPLEKNARELGRLIQDPKTYVYIAGHEKARDLMDRVMAKVLGSEDNWRRKKAEMTAGERWAEVIY